MTYKNIIVLLISILLITQTTNAQDRKTTTQYRFNTQIKNDTIDTLTNEIDSIRIEQNTINQDCKNHIQELLKIIEEEKKKDPDKNKKE